MGERGLSEQHPGALAEFPEATLDLSLLDGAVDLEGCILRQAVMGGGSVTQVLFCMQFTDISHGNSDLKACTFGFANE